MRLVVPCMKLAKRWLDLFLGVVGILSLAVLFLANEDPWARNSVCDLIKICPMVTHAAALNKIAYDLAVAALISLIFYILVVRIPEWQKRQRYKKLLTRQYMNFRTGCISTMLLVADGSYGGDLPEKLLDQEKFQDYFNESSTKDQSRWSHFCNNLDRASLRELLTQMEIFRDEIAFILNNVDIPSDEPLQFLRNLSSTIIGFRDATPEYDDVKPFARFLWSIFTGFNFVDGYANRKIIEGMIEAI